MLIYVYDARAKNPSVYVFQNALPNQVLTLRAQQIVLAVLEQLDHRPVLALKLPIVHQAANFNVEALGGVHVLGEVQPVLADGAHVAGKGAVVAGEPLRLLLAQTELELRREHAAHLPAVVADGGHAVVDVGEQAALVALEAGVAQLYACKESLLPVGGGSHLELVLFEEGSHLLDYLFRGNRERAHVQR